MKHIFSNIVLLSLLLNILIVPSVSAQETFSNVKSNINTVQNTNPNLPAAPSGSAGQKGLMGNIIANIFTSAGKIRSDFLDFMDPSTNTINAESIEGLQGLTGSDANKVLKWGSGELSATNIYESGGKVGIGTATPTETFTIGDSRVVVHAGGGPSIGFNTYWDKTAKKWSDGGYAGTYKALLHFSPSNGEFGLYSRQGESPLNTLDWNSLILTGSGNVGIGHRSPKYKLHVAGNINFDGDLYKNGQPYQAPGKWSDGTGTGAIYYNGGNVGIGTNIPSQKLDVVGNIKASGNLLLGGTLSGDSITDNTIDSSEIQNESITAADLAPNSVGNSELIDSPLFTQVSLSSGNDNGYRFWNSDSYEIAMGNTASYKYGPVTDYSIKTNMSNTAGRGFTWGVSGQTPKAALEATTGNFQTAGRVRAENGLQIGSDAVFIRDAANRIATDDQFYVRAASPNTLLYSTNTYLGNTSGDTTHLRGNTFRWNQGIIQGNGNVGIGTNSPNQKLEVAGSMRLTSSAPTIQFNDTTDNNFIVHNNTNTLYFMHDANNNMNWDDGDDDRIVMRSPGDGLNLGIGTSDPSAKLDVHGTVEINQGATYDIWIEGSGTTGAAPRNLAILGQKSNDRLYLNYNGEYSGGTFIGGNSEWEFGIGDGLVSGNYGSVQTYGSGKGGWEGYSINGRYNFMSADNNQAGIYNDIDNKWITYFSRNSVYRIYRPDTSGGVAMQVNANGNIGIGTTNPAAKLDVNGSIRVKGLDATSGWSSFGGAGFASNIYVSNGQVGNGTANSGVGGIKFRSGSSGVFGHIFNYVSSNGGAWGGAGISNQTLAFTNANQSNTNLAMFFNLANGRLGIGVPNPSQKLHVNGSALATAWNTTSDESLKTNIKKISSPLEKLGHIRGVSFDWKKGNKHDIGVIAQEVEEVLPEIVTTDSQGVKSVDYSKLAPLLIESIKQQQKMIQKQQEEINSLKSKI